MVVNSNEKSSASFNRLNVKSQLWFTLSVVTVVHVTYCYCDSRCYCESCVRIFVVIMYFKLCCWFSRLFTLTLLLKVMTFYLHLTNSFFFCAPHLTNSYAVIFSLFLLNTGMTILSISKKRRQIVSVICTLTSLNMDDDTTNDISTN